jgi:hypothetical protein
VKVEAAIAMLQSIPAGSEVDLQIRRIVTPDQAVKPRRTSADRMRELRARRNGSNAPPASQVVTSVTKVTPSDASDGAERHGGTMGGSDPDKTEKSGKETGITGSHLSGKGSARGESDANSDAGDASHSVTPSRGDGTTTERAAVRLVFEAWQRDTGHHRAILDKKRGRRILARLREGFTPERMILAITNRRNDPWLMGQGDSPRVFDEIDVVLRDAAQVERLERLTEPTKPRGVNGSPVATATPEDPAVARAKAAEVERRIREKAAAARGAS